jgi:hypothetical protein
MTLSTWIVFGMSAFVFFNLGRAYQKRKNKELERLARDIVEEARIMRDKKSSGL